MTTLLRQQVCWQLPTDYNRFKS